MQSSLAVGIVSFSPPALSNAVSRADTLMPAKLGKAKILVRLRPHESQRKLSFLSPGSQPPAPSPKVFAVVQGVLQGLLPTGASTSTQGCELLLPATSESHLQLAENGDKRSCKGMDLISRAKKGLAGHPLRAKWDEITHELLEMFPLTHSIVTHFYRILGGRSECFLLD